MRHQAQYRAKESFQTEVILKESADGRNAVRFFDAKAKKEVPPLQECTSLCSCVTVRKRSAYLLSESLSSFFSSSASAVICAGWSASSSSSSASTAPANEQNPPSHPPASGALSSLSDSSGFGASVSVFFAAAVAVVVLSRDRIPRTDGDISAFHGLQSCVLFLLVCLFQCNDGSCGCSSGSQNHCGNCSCFHNDTSFLQDRFCFVLPWPGKRQNDICFVNHKKSASVEMYE